MSFLKSMQRASINFLHSFDLFGIPVQLQIKKKSEYHTTFGSIISLAIMSFICYSFVNLIVDLFERKNPNIISNLVFNENPTVTISVIFIGNHFQLKRLLFCSNWRRFIWNADSIKSKWNYIYSVSRFMH